MRTPNKWVSLVLTLLAGGYGIGLALYLLLRLIFADRYWPLAFINNFTLFYFLPLILTVPLLALLRARRMLIINVPLLIVGLTYFITLNNPPARAQAQETGDRTLTVASMNTLWINARLGDTAAWLLSTNADVLCLQEMSEANDAALSAALGKVYPYQISDNGNAIYSRYPLKPFIQQGDGTGVFGILGAEITFPEVSANPIAVYSVHFPLPTGSRRLPDFLERPSLVRTALKYDETGRDREIRDFLTLIRDQKLPYIVAGDFNMSDQTALYSEVVARMGDSFREAGYGPGFSWPVASMVDLPAFFPALARIDYVWHSGQFRAVQAYQGPSLGSDHLPLVAVVALKR